MTRRGAGRRRVGLDRSTRSPSGATTRSIRWATVASSSARPVRDSLPPRSIQTPAAPLTITSVIEGSPSSASSGPSPAVRADTWRTMVSSSPAPSRGASRRHELDDRGPATVPSHRPRAFEQLRWTRASTSSARRHAALRSARSSERGQAAGEQAGVDRPSDGCFDGDLGANRHTEHVFDVPRAESRGPRSLDEHDTRGTQRAASAPQREIARTNHEQRDRRRGGHRARAAPTGRTPQSATTVRASPSKSDASTSARAVASADPPPRGNSQRPGAASTSMRLSAVGGDACSRAEPLGQTGAVWLMHAEHARRVAGEIGEDCTTRGASERQRQRGGNHSGTAAAFGGPASDEHGAPLGTRSIRREGSVRGTT